MTMTAELVGSLDIMVTGFKHTISGSFRLMEDAQLLEEKIITIRGYRYEADSLSDGILAKFDEELKQWILQRSSFPKATREALEARLRQKASITERATP